MKLIFAIAIIFLVGAGAFFLATQAKVKQLIVPSANYTQSSGVNSTLPPSSQTMFLTISSPKNGEVLTASTTEVKGKTVGGSEVFINDQETKADSNGNFSVLINLDEGENIINIIANDKDGAFKEEEITVIYETP